MGSFGEILIVLAVLLSGNASDAFIPRDSRGGRGRKRKVFEPLGHHG